MASATFRIARRIGLSTTGWDGVMVALAAAHGVVLLARPAAPIVALLFWWNANTISHNFIHRRFFQSRSANRCFAAYLTVLLGFPHQLWRDRHLAHHAETPSRTRLTLDLLARPKGRAYVAQTTLASLPWFAMVAWAPNFLLASYLPGIAGGLVLCALHGYYEHARGTTSHYGRLYNFLFFNDGYHVEHHAHPSTHWTRLPEYAAQDDRAISAWPAPLRWMEAFNSRYARSSPLAIRAPRSGTLATTFGIGTLEALERLAIRVQPLQRFVVRTHANALSGVIGCSPPVDRVAIVGGGLFPRTAIILRELLPNSRITIIDANETHLECARRMIEGRMCVEYVHGRYPDVDVRWFDLVVFPLSFDGKRDDLYAHPPARAVIVHDWIWRKRGTSRIVSLALCKRVNLVTLARP